MHNAERLQESFNTWDRAGALDSADNELSFRYVARRRQ